MNEEDRGTWLQVRMTNEEKRALVDLAAEYDVSLSQMVRLMTAYFSEKHPQATLRFGPKANALAQEVAGAL